jgi:hypothetical protein
MAGGHAQGREPTLIVRQVDGASGLWVTISPAVTILVMNVRRHTTPVSAEDQSSLGQPSAFSHISAD